MFDVHENHRGDYQHYYNNAASVSQSSPIPTSGAALSATAHGSHTADSRATKTITSSQTWPQISERSPVAINAHCIVTNDRKPNAYENKTHYEDPHGNGTRTEHQGQNWYGDEEDDPYCQQVYKPGYPSGNFLQRRYSPSHYGYRAPPPPPTYPNVLYTNLTTPFTSPSPLFFKPKQKKRRYDGIPGDDMHECYKPPDHHHLSHDRGEVSSPFYDDADVSQPYILSDPNDDGFGYGSKGHNYYHHTILDASGFAVSEEEAYPFEEEDISAFRSRNNPYADQPSSYHNRAYTKDNLDPATRGFNPRLNHNSNCLPMSGNFLSIPNSAPTKHQHSNHYSEFENDFGLSHGHQRTMSQNTHHRTNHINSEKQWMPMKTPAVNSNANHSIRNENYHGNNERLHTNTEKLTTELSSSQPKYLLNCKPHAPCPVDTDFNAGSNPNQNETKSQHNCVNSLTPSLSGNSSTPSLHPPSLHPQPAQPPPLHTPPLRTLDASLVFQHHKKKLATHSIHPGDGNL